VSILRPRWLILSVFAAMAGVGAGSTHAQAVFDRRPLLIEDPVPRKFTVCYGHSCSVVAIVALTAEDWQAVRRVFGDGDGAPGPADERARIADAIALLERLVGGRTGTWRDHGGDLKGFARPGQMDCVDEATNSTTYLRMFAGDRLLRWHKVGPIMKRGHLLWGLPHATAVIVDSTSGQPWAVDAWYRDNGQPPHIVPYGVWKDGWSPPQE
jgi:hypothetical protein